MVSEIMLSVVPRGFEHQLGQAKHYKIEIGYWFSAKHASLRCESKDCMTHHQDNVSDLSDTSNS